MGAGLSSKENGNGCADDKDDDQEEQRKVSIRFNLIFPNEILEKILSFLTVRDKLIARQVCTDWMHHINTGGGLQDSVKVKVCSDELNYLASSPPVFTAFYFHKLDLTRQSMNFWDAYSDVITHLDFYDCSVIPRNTENSNQATFSLGCPNLKHLSLVNCDKYFLMGGNFIQLDEILCLENLESLNLSRNKNLSDSILFSILLKTKHLRKLDLSDCINMVFMKAVHNRFYPESRPRPPYSDHILSFHTLCEDFLNSSSAKEMISFNFGMKLNSTGMSLLLSNDCITWKYANLESPELKTTDVKQFLQKYSETLLRVDLGRCKLTTEDIFHANLFSVQEISMYDSRTITSLNFLATMPNLQRLVIDGMSGFQLQSEYFHQVPKLRELSLNGIKPIDPLEVSRAELLKIFEILPNLSFLDIGNCGHLVNDEICQGIISHLKYLKNLSLEACKITDYGFTGIRTPDQPQQQLIRCLSQLSYLEHLNLSHCRDLTDLTWLFALRLSNLISLNLSNCNSLSKRGMLSIVDCCRNLEKLVLVHCPAQILHDPEVVAITREKLYRCSGITY